MTDFREGQTVKCGGEDCTILEIDNKVVVLKTPYTERFVTTIDLIKPE